MKTKNIYDHLDKDIGQVDEKTIIGDPDVNTDNVKKLFREKLNAQENSGKTSSRKIKRRGKKRTILIAAAVAASMVVFGAVGAGAAGSFDSVFGENFAGDKVDGVYSGGNVSVSSADGYKTEFLGIAGDYHSVAAAVNITKADGSAFVSGDNIRYTYILDTPYGIIGEKDEEEFREAAISAAQGESKVTVNQSLWNKVTNNSKAPAEDGLRGYYLTSPDKIKFVMKYDDPEYSLVGQKLTFNTKNLYIYNVTEEIASCRIDEGYDAECILAYGRNGFEYQSKNTALVDSVAEKLSAAVKNKGEGEYIVRHFDSDGTNTKIFYCIARINCEAVDINGSCKLNYKPIEHTQLEIKENSFSPKSNDGDSWNGHKYSEVSASIEKIDAGTFNSQVRIVCKGDTSPFDYTEGNTASNKWYSSLREYLTNNSFEIKLSSGKTVYGTPDIGSWKENDDGSVEIMLLYFTEKDWISIAPEDITSVTLAGSRII